MRGVIRFMALVFCLLFIVGSAYAETGVVTASALTLREGPGSEYAILGEIPYGASIELLRYNDGWYYVRFGSQTGYVYARYVRVDLPEESSSEVEAYAEWSEADESADVFGRPDLSLPALTFDGQNNPNYPGVMKPGDMGESVTDLQITLQKLGYGVDADGQYGYETQAAVMKLQLAMGIDADGIFGAKTRKLIGNDNVGGVELLDWWLGGNVAFARLTEAVAVDTRTGIRFRISRYGGDNHCEVEPLTAKDTEAFWAVCGGWSEACRPIWLEVEGRVIAASIGCMPGKGENIGNNNVDGHFCLYFYNSYTHDGNQIDTEHAACVQEAWDNRLVYQ